MSPITEYPSILLRPSRSFMKIDPTISARTVNLLIHILITLFSLMPAANAWNNVGHRAIAELAWRQMNDAERGAAADLLKHHPHYKEFLITNVPAGVDTNEWAFLMAAIWPDWVRPAKHGQPHKSDSITKYDLYPHAIGYPFLRPSETNRALLDNFFIKKPDAEMVLSNSIATLGNKNASDHDRAVSLAWTLHLFGDLHHPLHAATLVTKEKPRGEGLGGDYVVLDPRKKPQDKEINLHSFWDQLPGVESSYQSIARVADRISAAPEFKPSALKEYAEDKSIHSWVQESYQIAVNFAYAKEHVQFAQSSDLKSGKISASDIPILKTEYIHKAEKIALRRLALAGQRLADELKNDF